MFSNNIISRVANPNEVEFYKSNSNLFKRFGQEIKGLVTGQVFDYRESTGLVSAQNVWEMSVSELKVEGVNAAEMTGGVIISAVNGVYNLTLSNVKAGNFTQIGAPMVSILGPKIESSNHSDVSRTLTLTGSSFRNMSIGKSIREQNHAILVSNLENQVAIDRVVLQEVVLQDIRYRSSNNLFYSSITSILNLAT